MNIHKSPNPPQVRADIYFGGNIPEASQFIEREIDGVPYMQDQITDTMFGRFLEEYVTPNYPGFTVTTSQGYWKGKPETVRILTLLAPDSNSFRDNVRMMAERYKTEFGQEAVAYAFTACEFALDCWPFGPIKTYHREGKGY